MFQTFLIDHGLTGLGAPNWRLGPILPGAWLLPLQTVIVLGGFAATLYVGQRIGRRDFGSPPQAMRALLPWLLVWLALAAQNLATVGVWVHTRGFVILALLLFGNLFCICLLYTSRCV